MFIINWLEQDLHLSEGSDPISTMHLRSWRKEQQRRSGSCVLWFRRVFGDIFEETGEGWREDRRRDVWWWVLLCHLSELLFVGDSLPPPQPDLASLRTKTSSFFFPRISALVCQFLLIYLRSSNTNPLHVIQQSNYWSFLKMCHTEIFQEGRWWLNCG